MGQAILLRTLTEESIIGFGKWTDLKVGDVLAKKYYVQIRWIYYNCSMITFFDNILEEVGITKGDRIEKPGKNPDKFKELQKIFVKYRSFLNNSHLKSKARKIARGKISNTRRVENIRYSKGVMQSKNQGH